MVHSHAPRRWAVVEIRRDGSLGSTELISAPDAPEAAALSRTSSLPPDVVNLPALDAGLAQLQAAHGYLHEATQTLIRHMHSADNSPDRSIFAGQLALVEAYQGELRQAQTHVDLAMCNNTPGRPENLQHARLAKAWVHLERTEHEECKQILDLVEVPIDDQQPSWFAVARHLLLARLLVATHYPDAACRLLAVASDGPNEAQTGWANGVLAAAHAEALLATGESRRALASLTPLPEDAEVEAAVATAAGRQAIGDSRGAGTVLRTVVEALERAPLGLQVRSWILEARIADEHGQPQRSRQLVERALHTAAPDGLRAPLLWDWCWLRAFVERDPALLHTYRGFLLGLHDTHSVGIPPARTSIGVSEAREEVLTSTLTEREAQVLDLLAEMYSTDEIAHALYVSTNTVKTHVKGIFAKLCVNRRVDAVRRGRQLGLL